MSALSEGLRRGHFIPELFNPLDWAPQDSFPRAKDCLAASGTAGPVLGMISYIDIELGGSPNYVHITQFTYELSSPVANPHPENERDLPCSSDQAESF